MASRTANIKIKLSSGAFVGELKNTEAKVQKSAKKMGASLGREMDTGFKKGTAALGRMSKGVGRLIKQAATIGGAFAAGALLRDSMQINKTYQDLSFLLSKMPDQAMSWQQVQSMIEGSAERTTRTSMEMAASFEQVYKATGDLEYSKKILDMIGISATASGKPIEQLAQVAEMVRRKYGATGKEAEEMMAIFIEKSDKGGLSLDQLSSRLDLVAGVAQGMGIDVSELLGMITQLDAKMGAMAPRGLKTMFEYLQDGTTQAISLEKAGRFKFKPDMDALDRLRKIIVSPKATKVALKTFTETSGHAFRELQKPFVETLAASKAAGDSDKVAREKAAAAYDKMVADIRKTEMSSAAIRRSFEARKEDDPSVKMRQALNKIRDAFAQPKMIDAIGKLADKLPALAKVVADLVSFIVDNPLGAAGVGMGLRVGAPMMMQGIQWRSQMAAGGGYGTMPGQTGTSLGGGAAAGSAKLGKQSTVAAGNVKKMGQSAFNAIGQFAGVASLGYAAAKAAEAWIEAEGEKFDVAEKRRETSTKTFLQAKSAGSTFGDKLSAIETLKKDKKGALKDMAPSALDIFSQQIEAISGQRSFSDIGKNTEAIAEFKKNNERIAILNIEAKKDILKRLEAEKQSAKNAEDISIALGNAAKSLGELAGSLKSSRRTPAKSTKGKSKGTRQLNDVPGSEPMPG